VKEREGSDPPVDQRQDPDRETGGNENEDLERTAKNKAADSRDQGNKNHGLTPAPDAAASIRKKGLTRFTWKPPIVVMKTSPKLSAESKQLFLR
jgi:hypothetical protein